MKDKRLFSKLDIKNTDADRRSKGKVFLNLQVLDSCDTWMCSVCITGALKEEKLKIELGYELILDGDIFCCSFSGVHH